MSANDDLDPTARAWLERMPSEMPDRVLADVLQAVERMPQARPSLVRTLMRSPVMKRPIILVAGVAAALVVVIGASILSRPGPSVGAPSPSTPELTPSPLPAALTDQWAMATGPIAGLANTDAWIGLTVATNGAAMAIRPTDRGGIVLSSRSMASSAADEIVLMLINDDSGCAAGAVGRYRWTVSTDGATATFETLEDACAVRSAALSHGPWTRAVDGGTTGGRGVMSGFSIPFLVTLPASAYSAGRGVEGAEVDSPGGSLVAVEDPYGYTDPCGAEGGAKKPITPTIAAFSAYVASLPGFTVHSTDLTIDGRPAVRLEVPSTSTADCATHKVQEFTVPSGTGGWHLNQGDTDVIYLTEVDGHLALLQWLGFSGPVTQADEMAVMSTIHFLVGGPAAS